jgi:hypothetical protein
MQRSRSAADAGEQVFVDRVLVRRAEAAGPTTGAGHFGTGLGTLMNNPHARRLDDSYFEAFGPARIT